MKPYKLLAPAIMLSLAISSCTNKTYNCVCADDFCPTPYVHEEIKGKSKGDAKAQCDTYDNYYPQTGLTVNCEIETTSSSAQ